VPIGFRRAFNSGLAGLALLAIAMTTMSAVVTTPASAATTADVKIDEVESNGGTPGD
jgi:hypothetical protein